MDNFLTVEDLLQLTAEFFKKYHEIIRLVNDINQDRMKSWPGPSRANNLENGSGSANRVGTAYPTCLTHTSSVSLAGLASLQKTFYLFEVCYVAGG